MNASIKIIRTDSSNKEFISLVEELDSYLTAVNGENDSFFRSFNQIEMLQNVVIVYTNDLLVGCGAFKRYDINTVEVKRMYVRSGSRRTGIARAILAELENWARELEYSKCILETAIMMDDAVSFYKNNGYYRIPNYDQYIHVDSSICFEKLLK